MIRLVVTDLDGTLLTSERTLAPRGGALLKRAAENGVRVILASMRVPHNIRPFCESLAIRDPFICMDGAQVWGSPDGPVWAEHRIPREAALALAQHADAHGWELCITVGTTTYFSQRPGQPLGPLGPHMVVLPCNTDAVTDDPLRILTYQPDAIDALQTLCRTSWPEHCRTDTYYGPDGALRCLGIFAPGASKGQALALVLDRLGITPDHVLAIGDGLNDVPMFAHARIGVAMGNALDEVKHHATAVAPSHDEEGVAWALDHFLSGKTP